MSGGRHHPFLDDDMFNEWIIQFISPKEASKLTSEQISVIRAHIRSEILFSPEIRNIISNKIQEVHKKLV